MVDKKFDNLLFIDTETTGTSSEDRIFQVSYKFKGEEKNELFKPPVKISIEAMEVTQVTNKEVADKDPFINSEMKKDLEVIFNDEKNIFVAHNAKFDIEMLEKEGLKIGKFIDTLKIAQYLDKEAKIPYYRLQYLRYFLGLEVKNAIAHDALGDIRVLEALFFRLYEKMLSEIKDEEKVLEKMVEISKQPLLIKKIKFGKYKGEFVEDVAQKDRSYLEWLFREKQKASAEGDFDEDWIYTLEHYLN